MAFVLLVCVHRTVIERLPPGDIGTSVLLPSRGFFETKTKAEAASNSPASDLAPTSTSGSARAALLLFCSVVSGVSSSDPPEFDVAVDLLLK